MIPKKIHDKVRESGWYKSDCEFVWAYCRYFWECHVQLPEIDIDELEKMVNG
jgi:hypothetical protein